MMGTLLREHKVQVGGRRRMEMSSHSLAFHTPCRRDAELPKSEYFFLPAYSSIKTSFPMSYASCHLGFSSTARSGRNVRSLPLPRLRFSQACRKCGQKKKKKGLKAA